MSAGQEYGETFWEPGDPLHARPCGPGEQYVRLMIELVDDDPIIHYSLSYCEACEVTWRRAEGVDEDDDACWFCSPADGPQTALESTPDGLAEGVPGTLSDTLENPTDRPIPTDPRPIPGISHSDRSPNPHTRRVGDRSDPLEESDENDDRSRDVEGSVDPTPDDASDTALDAVPDTEARAS